MKFLLGTKAHMTRIFQEDGNAVPVTAVVAGPCVVTSVKNQEKDGYTAVQIGYGKAKLLNKPQAGHIKGLPQVKHVREFRVDQTEGIERGATIDVTTFAVGDKVKVVGTSKGRGFQGVVKRHGFKGSPASHGHKDQLRMPGSIGATDPARVFKGTKMGGQMGNKQVTVANLKVIEIDPETNTIFLNGAVPGARGTLLKLQADGELTFVENKSEVKEEAPEVQEEAPTTDEAKEEKKDEAPVEESKEEGKKEEAPVEDKKEEDSKEDSAAEDNKEKETEEKKEDK